MKVEIASLGEALVELIRPTRDMPLDKPDKILGPFPNGAPAIFADSASTLGGKTGFIGVVGNDDFGQTNKKEAQAR